MGDGSPTSTEFFGCCPLPSKESALSYSLVRGALLHAVFSNNLGALSRSTRAPHFQHHMISPDLRSRCFLVIGIRRLRFCHAEPNYCSPELSQPSPVAVVPLVALPPPCPCLHREQFRRSTKAILLGVPTTRQQTDATCVLLRPWMPNTRFAKFLRGLGCSRSTPAAPHKAASLSQEVTLWSRVLSQRRRRMPNTFCACQFRFRSPTRRAFVTCFAEPSLPTVPQDMWTRQNRLCTFPSFIFLVPSLRRCDYVWPSLSSFRSENETANAADDRLARFDSSLVRGVVTRSFLGQFVSPFVASSHEAANLIQLGSLRLGQVRFTCRHGVDVGFAPNVSEAVPDPSPHVSVRSSRRSAPFRPTFQASVHCRTIRHERCSWFRQDDGLPKVPTILPARYAAALGGRSAWHHALSKPARGKSRGFAPVLIRLVLHGIHACTQRNHQRTACLRSCCQQHLGVSTHESYHRACVQECTSQQGRASGLSPT